MKNLYFARIALLRGAQNPHVLNVYIPVFARRAPRTLAQTKSFVS